MTFSGSFVDTQPLSDISIRHALADEICHLLLPLGQSRNGSLAQRWELEEATDLANESIYITDVGKMRSSRKFNQPRTFDARCDELALLQRCGAVVSTVQHKGWSSDVPEAIQHINFVAGDKKLGGGLRRR